MANNEYDAKLRNLNLVRFCVLACPDCRQAGGKQVGDLVARKKCHKNTKTPNYTKYTS